MIERVRVDTRVLHRYPQERVRQAAQRHLPRPLRVVEYDDRTVYQVVLRLTTRPLFGTSM